MRESLIDRRMAKACGQRSRRYGFAFVCSLLCAGANQALADIAIETTDVDGRFVLTVQDATVEAVLSKLGEGKGFAVERATEGTQTGSVSGRFVGTTSEIIARVLEDENYFVEYSSRRDGAISRVMLYGHAQAKTSANTSANAVGAMPAQKFSNSGPMPLPAPVLAPVPRERHADVEPDKSRRAPLSVAQAQSSFVKEAIARSRGGRAR